MYNFLKFWGLELLKKLEEVLKNMTGAHGNVVA
jgi:hypothetical protein